MSSIDSPSQGFRCLDLLESPPADSRKRGRSLANEFFGAGEGLCVSPGSFKGSPLPGKKIGKLSTKSVGFPEFFEPSPVGKRSSSSSSSSSIDNAVEVKRAKTGAPSYFDSAEIIRGEIFAKEPFSVSLPDGTNVAVSNAEYLASGTFSDVYKAMTRFESEDNPVERVLKLPKNPGVIDPKDKRKIHEAVTSEFTLYSKNAERLRLLEIPFARNYTLELAKKVAGGGAQVVDYIPDAFDPQTGAYDKTLIRLFTEGAKRDLPIDLHCENVKMKEGICSLVEITHPDDEYSIFFGMEHTLNSFFSVESVQLNPERKAALTQLSVLWRTWLGGTECDGLDRICAKHQIRI